MHSVTTSVLITVGIISHRIIHHVGGDIIHV